MKQKLRQLSAFESLSIGQTWKYNGVEFRLVAVHKSKKRLTFQKRGPSGCPHMAYFAGVKCKLVHVSKDHSRVTFTPYEENVAMPVLQSDPKIATVKVGEKELRARVG